MLRHVSIIRSSSGSCLFLAKIILLKIFTAWFSYNSFVMWQHVVLCRSSVVRSALDCVCVVCYAAKDWLIFKSFNLNNLSVFIAWCTDQVTLRSARCDDKDKYWNVASCWLYSENIVSDSKLGNDESKEINRISSSVLQCSTKLNLYARNWQFHAITNCSADYKKQNPILEVTMTPPLYPNVTQTNPVQS